MEHKMKRQDEKAGNPAKTCVRKIIRTQNCRRKSNNRDLNCG